MSSNAYILHLINHEVTIRYERPRLELLSRYEASPVDPVGYAYVGQEVTKLELTGIIGRRRVIGDEHGWPRGAATLIVGELPAADMVSSPLQIALDAIEDGNDPKGEHRMLLEYALGLRS